MSALNMDSLVAAVTADQDAFTVVKEAVPMREAVSFYGYEPNRAGFICCPIHAEKTPSMKIYPRAFHCFGCGAHGSVIDFVALLFNLKPLDAVKKLNEDFRIGLDVEHPPDRPDRERQRQAQRLFSEWRERTLNDIDKSIRVANLADFDELTDAAAVALRFREILEHWADELLHGTTAEQMKIYRNREGVNKVCRTILQNTPTRSSAA